MKSLGVIAIISMILICGDLHATSPVQVSLTLDESSVLAGTSTGMTIEVTNPGHAPVTLPGVKNAIIERVIERYPDLSYTQSLQLALALRYKQQHSFEHELKDRQAKAERARQIATDLARSAESPHLRAHARRILQGTPTSRELAERASRKAEN
jgi:hypothetical protein